METFLRILRERSTRLEAGDRGVDAVSKLVSRVLRTFVAPGLAEGPIRSGRSRPSL